MNTTDLIQLLAKADLPKRPVKSVIIFIGWFGLTVIATVCILKLRPDFDVAVYHFGMWSKSLLLTTVALCSLTEFKRLFSLLPQAISLQQKISYGIVISIVLSAMSYTLLTTPMPQILKPFTQINFPECLFFVTTYGLLGVVTLISSVRQYAPSNLNNASLALGFSSASVSAVGYSIHCTIDNPVFIIVAYGAAIILTSCISRVIVPNLIKW